MNSRERSFYGWLAGFIDGEGCFSLKRNPKGVYSTALQIALRCDDWRVIDEIYRTTGLGTVGWRPGRTSEGGSVSQPGVYWFVLRAQECKMLVDRLVEAGGLRAKKERDFKLWASAVELLCLYGGSSSGKAAGDLARIKEEMHKIKEFSPEFAEGYQGLTGVHDEPRPNENRLMHYKKLTQAQVEEIIRLRNAGTMSQKDIAAMFGVGQMAISRIVNGFYRRVGESTVAIKSRLTNEQIDTLVDRYVAGERPVALQQEYGVSSAQFYRYAHGDFDRRYHRSEAS